MIVSLNTSSRCSLAGVGAGLGAELGARFAVRRGAGLRVVGIRGTENVFTWAVGEFATAGSVSIIAWRESDWRHDGNGNGEPRLNPGSPSPLARFVSRFGDYFCVGLP